MSAEARHSSRELLIACRLTDEEQGRRREELASKLFSGCKVTNELDDGYEFAFPGEANWAEKLMSFILSERECCPFFIFELIFDPEGGEISLRIRGPEGTKELLGAELVERGSD